MKRDSSGNGTDGPPTKRSTVDLSNVVLRFLIPARAAGIMIGKGGENIKKIRSQYNLKLNIPDNRGPERIMTIEGDLGAICTVMKEVSPKLRDIMNAKLSDPRRIMGNYVPRRRARQGDGDEPEKEEDEDENMLDYRILVHESQAGSVIGRGGDRIKELRDRFKMRVIKVYQMLAPMSTDRVVQMVAEPDNAINCLKAVVEAVESAPPRGRREDYDAMNFSEPDALNYGGWLSKEAAQALSQGVPPGRFGGMPPMGYMGNPYMMGCGDYGPMPPPGMGPMGMGPMHGGPPPMGRGPMGGGRGPPGGGRGRGGMMGGGAPPAASQRSGPAPVPPPGAPRGGNAQTGAAAAGAYGNVNVAAPYGGQAYDGSDGYGNSMYDSMGAGQTGYGAQGYAGPMASGMPPTAGYGAAGYAGGPRGAPDMTASGMPRGSYGNYGAAAQGAPDDAKVSQWYNEWS